MNLFTRALSKIFKSSNQQELNRIKPIIAKINEFDAKFANISDTQIKEIASSLKQQAKKGKNLETILPESFALVREASKRAIGEKHYDVQLAGGIILHEGKIAEMKTGEGKTLVATLPAFYGYYTKGGALEVGQASTKGVVNSSILIIIFNYLITQLLLS